MVGAAAGLLAACATGVDSTDPGAFGDDSGATPETSTARDGGRAGSDGAAAEDTGSSTTTEAGSSGDDSSQEDSSTEDASSGDDTGAAPDAGATSPGVCPGTAKYLAEALLEVASGNITFCFTGVCSNPAQCCYEQASPGNVCVAQ
jgi:hypothetical protein